MSSDFALAAALSVLAAACDGPAKHTKTPVASINAERPLALIFIWKSPLCQPPKAQSDPGACPQRGKKRESSGCSGRKQGSNKTVQSFR
jgi:hypothetical protein